jgi:hypothetical protein
MEFILQLETSMANGIVVYQFAIVSALAVVVLGLVIVFMRRKAQPEEPREVPITPTVVQKPVTVQRRDSPPPTRTINREVPVTAAPMAPPKPAVSETPVVVFTQDATQESRRQRILEDISANIRKNQFRPVPAYSPIQYPEKARESEYVRVKKQIITPHGQVRFSILKDSISLNMLAVFRRASMEWEKPEDLIGFIPSYLEPEVEILEDRILLIGTPGHNEKLAIPIRSVDAKSSFRDCFDFVTDVQTETNAPAVLLATDTEFEIVSRGVIIQPVFMNTINRVHTEVRVLERSLAGAKLLKEGMSL